MPKLSVRPNATLALLGAVALAAVAIAVAGYLFSVGSDVGGSRVLSYATPLVAGLFIAAKVDVLAEGQNKQLDDHSNQLQQITENTNGKLDARIFAGASKALELVLAEHDLIPKQAVPSPLVQSVAPLAPGTPAVFPVPPPAA